MEAFKNRMLKGTNVGIQLAGMPTETHKGKGHAPACVLIIAVEHGTLKKHHFRSLIRSGQCHKLTPLPRTGRMHAWLDAAMHTR